MSARVVQRYVLDEIDDDRLETFVVWGPMLGEETAEDAPSGSVYLNDPRSTHFWTGEHTLVEMLQKPIGLEDELAWDVFLVYAPGTEWGETPPVPDYYMHHGKSLPAERRLNGVKLHEQVRRLLEADAGAGSATASAGSPN